MLTIDAIGVSEQAQRARMFDIQKQTQFCVSMREIDTKRMDEILIRYSRASESIIWAKTHVEKAQGLHELAMIAREVDELPMRE